MRRVLGSRALGAVLSATLLLAFACGGNSSAPTSSGEVTIGGLCNLSGSLQPYGQACQDGLNLAVKQINGAGGFKVGNTKYKLKLSVSDGQSTPTAAVAAVTDLVQDQGIKYVFGPDTSPTALQVIGAVKDRDVIDFASGAAPQTVLGKPGYEKIFGQVLANPVWEPHVVDVFQALGVKTGRIAVAYPNDVTGMQNIPAMDAILKKAGYTSDDYYFPPNTTDFRPLVTKIKSTAADGIIVGYGVTQDLPFATAVAELSATKALIAVGGLPSEVPLKIAKDTGKPFPIPYGTVTSQPQLDQPTTPGMQRIKDLYVKQTSRDPSTLFASQVFPWWIAPVHVLTLAMQKAGTVDDVTAIAKQVPNVRYDAEIPNYHFGPDHIAVYGVDYCTIVDGKVTWKYTPPASA